MSSAAPKIKFKKLVTKPKKKDKPFFAEVKADAKKKVAVKPLKKDKKKVLEEPKKEKKLIQGKDSKLSFIKKQIDKIKDKSKEHAPTSEKVEQTQKSVDIGADLEKSSQAKGKQVDEMGKQKPKRFDAEKFTEDILTNVRSVIPTSEAEMENDGTSTEKMAEAQQSMGRTLDVEKQNAGGDIGSATTAEPDVAAVPDRLVEPLVPTELQEIPIIKNAGISPDLKTADETSLAKDSQRIDDKMSDSKVTEEQLKNANEPSFKAAVDEKSKSQEHAENTHQQYLERANPIKVSAEIQTQNQTEQGLARTTQARNQNLSQVDKNQVEQKGKEEEIRQKIANDLEAIYTETKTKVETRLENLNTEVNELFDQALQTANTAFEENVRRRTERSWLDDLISWASGIPREVENVFIEEQQRFIDSLRPAIFNIGVIIERELNAAVADIELGKIQVKTYWDNLDEESQKIGADIYASVNDQFTELETSVEEASESLKDDITTKFNEAVASLEETFNQIEEENKSWLERAFDAVVGAIVAIIEMKDMLLNILSKAADAIEAIILDPIGFLRNLISAIKLGFTNFASNALQHLKEGFIEWLMGNMPPSIQFPEKWDMKGIFQFVMSVLGLTWDNIKARATRMFGATVVAALETGFEIFMIIREEGIGGLWRYIQEQVGNLKTMVMDAIQNMLIEKVINAGITWIIGLFNPAGAFMKACKMIYDVITWFINNARRLLDLINSIVDSVALIVAGNLDRAANFVENSLRRAIPIVIGFLAGLLGIGDLSKKIQDILDRIQAPINRAIDWVLKKAGDFVKRIGRAVVNTARSGVSRLMSWLGLRKPFRANDNKTHSINVEGSENQPVIIIRSTPKTFQQLISDFQETEEYSGNKSRYDPRITEARKINRTFENALKKNQGDGSQEINHAEEFETMATALIDYIKDMFVDSNSDDKRQIEYSGLSNGVGKKMEAKVLINDGTAGQHTSTPSNPIYRRLFERKSRGGVSLYVQGHLLNAELGGPNNDQNLTPLSSYANGEHERIIERSVKFHYGAHQRSNENKKLYYSVEATDFGLNSPLVPLNPEKDEDSRENKKIKKINEIKEMEQQSVPRKLNIEAAYFRKDGENETKNTIFKGSIINRVDTSPDSYNVTID